MRRLLIPVDGSANSLCAIHHALGEYRKNPQTSIHLLNVRPRMSRYLAKHVSKRDREQWRQGEAEKALRPARELLDKSGIPYAAHVETGDTAEAVVAKARDLRCDCILISTARKDSLNRLLAASVTNRILALTDIPVEIVVGRDVSNLESIGIPAGVGLGIAGLIMLVLD